MPMTLSGDGTITGLAAGGLPDSSIVTADIANAAVTAAKLDGAQSGSAPIYAARAWVNFNGTGTVAIRASGNVSSITDNGTGDYTANFTTSMPDVNYAVATNASDLSNSGRQSCPKAIAAGSVRVTTTDTPGLTTDYTYVAISVFR